MKVEHLGWAIWQALVCAMGMAAAAVGVSDSETKLAQTTPYGGPASAYGIISKTQLWPDCTTTRQSRPPQPPAFEHRRS